MKLKNWKYYLSLYKDNRRYLVLLGVLSVCASAFMVLTAFAVRRIFDQSIPLRATRELILLGLALVVLQLLNRGFLAYVRKISLSVTKKVVTQLRRDAIHKLYDLSRRFYTGARAVALHTRIVQDTERIDIMSNALVAMIMPALLMTLMLVPVLIFLSPFLFLVLALLLPPVVFSTRPISRRVKAATRAYHRAYEAFSESIFFVLKAMDLTRILSAEDFETRRNAANAEVLREKSQNMAWLETLYRSTQESLLVIVSAVVIIIGGIAVIRETMSMGEVISFYAVLLFLLRHLTLMVGNISRVIEGNESLNAVMDFLNHRDPQPYSGRMRPAAIRSIKLKDVHFAYGNRAVLKGVDLELSKNEIVVLSGLSGSGKTTIVNLILGFYRPHKGRILANEWDYCDIDMKHLCRFFGVVQQDPVLFFGTLRENICYGMADCAHTDLVRATEMAMADGFIQELPEGYDTDLGKEAQRLSGGQRQRIAIARALLRDPDFLILDEPSNHLDQGLIVQLIQNIRTMSTEKSILIISHEPALLEIADKAFRLRNGVLEALDLPASPGGKP